MCGSYSNHDHSEAEAQEPVAEAQGFVPDLSKMPETVAVEFTAQEMMEVKMGLRLLATLSGPTPHTLSADDKIADAVQEQVLTPMGVTPENASEALAGVLSEIAKRQAESTSLVTNA